MGKLIEFAFDDSKPAAVQLEAIKDSLNRAGLKPPESVVLSQGKPYEDLFDSIAGGSRAESRAARGFPDESIEPMGFDSDEREAASVGHEEPLREFESEEIAGGHKKYRTRHIVGDEALETARRLNYGER